MHTLSPRLVATAVVLAAAAFARGVRAEDPPPAPAPGAGMDEPAPDEPETPAAALDAKIKVAVERGIAFLRSQQRADGSWGDLGRHAPTYSGGGTPYQHPTGATSIALYAMLKCDVPSTDPAVKRGFAWLKKTGLSAQSSAYEMSVALLAVTAVADPFKKVKDGRAAGARVRLVGEWREWATSLQSLLIAHRAPRGWRYRPKGTDPGGTEDVSSTQLAVLALSAADRCGVTTDTAIHAGAAAYVLTLQEPDGPETERAVHPRKKAEPTKPLAGGGYAPEKKPEDTVTKDRARGFHYSVHPTTKEHDKVVTGARTACGVGALALARWALDGPGAKRLAASARPTAAAIDTAVYDGLAWLSANWSPWEHRNGKNIYYLYCVERALDLTGADRLGGHIWYLEMVERLLPQQDAAKGFWDTHDAQVGDRNPVVDTALALLFLRRAAKGGVPIPIVTGDDDAPPVDNR